MSETKPLRIMGIKHLAEHFGLAQHRVDYAIRSRGIEPRVRVEGVRLFHRDQIPAIKAALAETAQPRPSVRNAGWDVLVEELVEGEADAS